MCTNLFVKIKIIKIIFGISPCDSWKKKKSIMQDERDKEIMGDRNGPT